MTTTLRCSNEAYERIHSEAYRKRRKGTTKVSVEAKDLRTLLMDHAALICACQDQGRPLVGPGVTR